MSAIMDPIATCNFMLEKIMSANADFFTGDKTIFNYVDVIKTTYIKVYIIDTSLPQKIVDEIAKCYKVINR